MRRRQLLSYLEALAVSAIPTALPSRLVLATPRRIGTLSTGVKEPPPFAGIPFWQGMRKLGYTEEQVQIESRWAEGRLEQLPALAAELVQTAPEVIVAFGSEATRAAKRATSTIPIVMSASGDPVGAGLVVSLARPGTNVTGLATQGEETIGKQLSLLKSLKWGITRIAVLEYQGGPSQPKRREGARRAAEALQLNLLPLEVLVPEDIDRAFGTMKRSNAEGLTTLSSPLLLREAGRIAQLASKYNIPAVYDFATYTTAGGLISYGPDLDSFYGLAAMYVDKILRGARPTELPVQQPTKFKLVINLQVARTLDITIPAVLKAGADELIDEQR